MAPGKRVEEIPASRVPSALEEIAVHNNFRPSKSLSTMILGIGFAAALIAVAVAAETTSESTAVLVRTRQGMVAGLTVGKVEQFRGVPYAAPPLADLRWRAPLPPKPYSGTLQATKFPAPCVQSRVVADLPAPNEDCLYLNLYRPTGSKEGKKMPVLIYFHGGGFAAGTGSARDGVELAAGNDMIVIMPNYRLGSFGWLGLSQLDAETANGSSSGNYGLLDMLASLQWIQDNIAAFGGDRENVTIAGTSAGGISVCALMTARLHERLFQRAIIESGECTPTSAYVISHETALLQGAKFAAKAGCTDPKTFTSCLRSKPASTLLSSSEGLGMFTANIGGSLLPKAPLAAIESGELERIPVIVGANHDEQKRNPVQTTGFPATAQTYDKYLKDAFGPLAPIVASEYPASAFADPAYAAGAAASDSGIPNGIGVCPMLTELGGALAKATQTFAYELNDPRGSGMPDSNGFELGSMHTAEIGFLYAEAKPGSHTPEQMQLAARMQHYWATFARTGHPKDGAAEWPALQAGSGNVLRFQPNGDVIVPAATVAAEHHCDFWTRLGY
jgi:para-nitrobenzyl esterase